MRCEPALLGVRMGEMIGLVVIIGVWGVLEAGLISVALRARERRAVVKWLIANTRDVPGERHVGTFEIATAVGLSEERVRDACTSSPEVYRAVGDREQWSIWPKERQRTSRKRGETTT